MTLKLEAHDVTLCLDELEREFLRVGAEKCKHLAEPSQLSAFFRVGLRAVSLLRGMYLLLSADALDSYDPVRRAFWESWQLQFEFRIVNSGTKAAKWFETKTKFWEADTKKLADFVESLQHGRPNYGREYGDLSEMTHPTEQATANSCTAALARLDVGNHAQQIRTSVAKLSDDFAGLLVREIWLVDASHEQLINIHISRAFLLLV